MTTPTDSLNFDSYVPVYDVVPEEWEKARPFFVEQLRKIANGVNVREIGWFLEEALLSGKQLFPSTTTNDEQQFRSVFRKTINTGALVAGVNAGVNHGIPFDVNFTLVDLWVAGTNSATFTARRITGNDVLMNATQIVITSPQIFDRSICVIEYILEI